MKRFPILTLLAVLLAFPPSAAFADAPVLTGVYFGEIGCGHCDAFLLSDKAKIEARYGVRVELETFDILKSDDYARCVRMLEERGQAFRFFPVLFIGENAYQGNSSVEKNLPEEIEFFLANGRYRSRVAEAPPAGGGFSARFLPVFAAGLLDGVNPCAFSTLLFFLSFLALRGRSRGAILAVGVVFILSVFAVYFFLGFGLLGGLRSLAGVSGAKTALNLIVCGLSVVLGVLSLRDAFRAKAGAAEDAVLKLPPALSRANHWVIRTFAGRSAVLLGAAVTGVAVSVLELACTGQIYLPTLAYINRTAASARSVALLLAYNAAFVLPLLGVFLVFFFGATHERIRAWYREKLFPVRLATALFFFGMAAVIWVA
jgi:cytochrome c biogenesis protein CcdA